MCSFVGYGFGYGERGGMYFRCFFLSKLRKMEFEVYLGLVVTYIATKLELGGTNLRVATIGSLVVLYI
jgi:hypothetical protein